MIDTLLINPNPSSPEKSSAILREALGIDLPNDYLLWVDKFGGSSLSSDVALPDENGNAVLAQFYNADKVALTYASRHGFSRNVPRNFVVVAYGPGGGVCIKIDAVDFGSVWFADYDYANDLLGSDESCYPHSSELPEIMKRMAADWTSFIRSR